MRREILSLEPNAVFLDSQTMVAQVDMTLDNVAAVLRDMGCTDADVVQAMAYCATPAAYAYFVGRRQPGLPWPCLAMPGTVCRDDLLFEVHATRRGVTDSDREQARNAFFAKSQACLRASPLGKRYGWGLHHDEHGRVALVGLGTEEYARLAKDDTLKQLKAMRSKRA